MKLINNPQGIVILVTLLLTLLLGLFPPWRYADGEFIGFHPAFDPPPPRADSLSIEEIPAEHVPIQIIPQSLYNPGEASELDADALRRPYIDIRKMLSVGALLFLGGITGVVITGRRREVGSP